MRNEMTLVVAAAILLGTTLPASAQQATTPVTGVSTAPATSSGDGAGIPVAGKLVLLFPSGGDLLDAQNQATLDKASRLHCEGRPIVMIVSGSTDLVGDGASNLLLSQGRANAVARGLLARGIPADRTHILAKGETNPAVATPRGTSEAQNRRVEIAWR